MMDAMSCTDFLLIPSKEKRGSYLVEMDPVSNRSFDRWKGDYKENCLKKESRFSTITGTKPLSSHARVQKNATSSFDAEPILDLKMNNFCA